MDSGYTAGGIEICTSSLQYIDFTSPGVDLKGRIMYGYGSNDFQFWINSVSTAKMTLNSSGTCVSASDKRLKFNEKPLTNALDVINQLEQVEYEQTHDMVDQYTADAPQS
ncbi:MAG: hypothetical protein ACKPKO_01760, partial [Candidatus Fonsibacter sp.]